MAAGLSTRFSMEGGLVSMLHRRQCFSVKLSEKTLGKERTIIMIFKPLIIKISLQANSNNTFFSKEIFFHVFL